MEVGSERGPTLPGYHARGVLNVRMPYSASRRRSHRRAGAPLHTSHPSTARGTQLLPKRAGRVVSRERGEGQARRSSHRCAAVVRWIFMALLPAAEYTPIDRRRRHSFPPHKTAPSPSYIYLRSLAATIVPLLLPEHASHRRHAPPKAHAPHPGTGIATCSHPLPSAHMKDLA